MLSTRSLAVLTALGVGVLCTVYSVGCVARTRKARKREQDDLARWEGEGGPPPPAGSDLAEHSAA